MTIETEVAALTTSVNTLTSAVNVSKATLDQSVSDAQAAQTAAETALDSFDDRYLGAKSSAPSLDNDGNALITGALYFNSTENAMYVYTGSSWVITTNYNNVTAPYTLAQDLNADGNDITAVGKIGIGTTSPYVKTEIVGGDFAIGGGAGSGQLGLEVRGTPLQAIPSAQVRGYVATGDSAIGVAGDLLIAPRTSAAASVRFITGTSPAERMRIDSSGNVGIGTSSPTYPLTVDTGAGTFSVRAKGSSSVTIASDASMTYFANTHEFYNSSGTSERMRIDSSGNLLVGQTSTGDYTTTAGSSLRASGFSTHTRDGGDVLLLNRLTSDGSILQFRKDNTTVGSIGTISSGDLYIADGRNAGIKLDGGNNQISPVNSSGSALDATLDLGQSGGRFKDLYLSGGVHLGGTASANKLDDYEEGTFTLNTAGDSTGVFQDTPSCRYTKIGNTVHVLIAFRIGTNFTGQNVGGLPFTANHSGMNSSFISTGVVLTSTNNTVSAAVGDLSTTVRFHDNQNTSDPHLPNTTAQYYRLNFTYQTNS